jgi:hypothetical protein
MPVTLGRLALMKPLLLGVVVLLSVGLVAVRGVAAEPPTANPLALPPLFSWERSVIVTGLVAARSDEEVEAILAGLDPIRRESIMDIAALRIASGQEPDERALRIALWLAAERTRRPASHIDDLLHGPAGPDVQDVGLAAGR